jgi:hypothetical protein
MLRFRRYRVFLAVAIFSIVAIYHFTTVRDWEEARDASLERLKTLRLKNGAGVPIPTPLAESKTESSADKVRFHEAVDPREAANDGT